MSGGEIERLAAFAAAGFVLGGASLTSLRLTTALYVSGGVLRPIALHVARMALIATALIWTALQGAGPLLAAATGLTVARLIAVRLLGRTA